MGVTYSILYCWGYSAVWVILLKSLHSGLDSSTHVQARWHGDPITKYASNGCNGGDCLLKRYGVPSLPPHPPKWKPWLGDACHGSGHVVPDRDLCWLGGSQGQVWYWYLMLWKIGISIGCLFFDKNRYRPGLKLKYQYRLKSIGLALFYNKDKQRCWSGFYKFLACKQLI